MRSKGLNIRVPRLGVNRHGVFYVRSSAQDASGRRRVTQQSLGTKDPLLAKVLALRFCLNLVSEELMADPRKTNSNYELDLSKGSAKSDGPEDHARMMEALKALKEMGPDHAFRSMMQRYAPPETLDPRVAASEIVNAAVSQFVAQNLTSPPLPTNVGKTLQQAIDEHVASEEANGMDPATVREKKSVFKEFVDYFGGGAFLSSITKTEISDRWQKAEESRASKNVSKKRLERFIEENRGKDKPSTVITLAPSRRAKRKGYLSVFFDWAELAGHYMHENPMTQRGPRKGKRAAQTVSYKEFSSEDLKKLFGLHFSERMSKPDWYWLPLISLYSGSRLGEISNLALSTFDVVDDIKVYDITHGKTAGSRRRVPIHSALLDLGIWEYVEFLKSEGETNFIWFRPLKTLGKSAGAEWGKWVERCGITDHSKTFHSFRSTAITDMYNSDAPNPAAIRDAVGHTGGTQGAHGGYMRGVALRRGQEMIESLDYPTVPLKDLRREDLTFSDYYAKEKARLTSPKFAAQQEARKRRAALQADREIRVAKRDKKKSR